LERSISLSSSFPERPISPSFSFMEIIVKSSVLTASRAQTFLRVPLLAEELALYLDPLLVLELKTVFKSIFSEALSVNRLTYPYVALYCCFVIWNFCEVVLLRGVTVS
jgi:hypothetical protein